MVFLPRPMVDLCAGGMAGATSVVFTYPLDLAHVRMTVAPPDKRLGLIDCLRGVVRNEGFLVLFRGISPTLMVCDPKCG